MIWATLATLAVLATASIVAAFVILWYDRELRRCRADLARVTRERDAAYGRFTRRAVGTPWDDRP